jgi:hypothetical protein
MPPGTQPRPNFKPPEIPSPYWHSTYSSPMSSTRLSQIQGHLSPNSPLVLTSSSANSQVITLTINYATRANCLSTPVLKALLAALSSINPQMRIGPSIDTEDPIVYADRVVRSRSSLVPKVIIIKSMGRVFCSGHDLREFHIANGNRDSIQTVFNLCNELMLTIRRLPQIVISQVYIFSQMRLTSRYKDLQQLQDVNWPLKRIYVSPLPQQHSLPQVSNEVVFVLHLL